MKFQEKWVSKTSRRWITIISVRDGLVMIRYPNGDNDWRSVEDIRKLYRKA